MPEQTTSAARPWRKRALVSLGLIALLATPPALWQLQVVRFGAARILLFHGPASLQERVLERLREEPFASELFLELLSRAERDQERREKLQPDFMSFNGALDEYKNAILRRPEALSAQLKVMQRRFSGPVCDIILRAVLSHFAEYRNDFIDHKLSPDGLRQIGALITSVEPDFIINPHYQRLGIPHYESTALSDLSQLGLSISELDAPLSARIAAEGCLGIETSLHELAGLAANRPRDRQWNPEAFPELLTLLTKYIQESPESVARKAALILYRLAPDATDSKLAIAAISRGQPFLSNVYRNNPKGEPKLAKALLKLLTRAPSLTRYGFDEVSDEDSDEDSEEDVEEDLEVASRPSRSKNTEIDTIHPSQDERLQSLKLSSVNLSLFRNVIEIIGCRAGRSLDPTRITEILETLRNCPDLNTPALRALAWLSIAENRPISSWISQELEGALQSEDQFESCAALYVLGRSIGDDAQRARRLREALSSTDLGKHRIVLQALPSLPAEPRSRLLLECLQGYPRSPSQWTAMDQELIRKASEELSRWSNPRLEDWLQKCTAATTDPELLETLASICERCDNDSLLKSLRLSWDRLAAKNDTGPRLLCALSKQGFDEELACAIEAWAEEEIENGQDSELFSLSRRTMKIENELTTTLVKLPRTPRRAELIRRLPVYRPYGALLCAKLSMPPAEIQIGCHESLLPLTDDNEDDDVVEEDEADDASGPLFLRGSRSARSFRWEEAANDSDRAQALSAMLSNSELLRCLRLSPKLLVELKHSPELRRSFAEIILDQASHGQSLLWAELFGPDLRGSPLLRAELLAQLPSLISDGPLRALLEAFFGPDPAKDSFEKLLLNPKLGALDEAEAGDDLADSLPCSFFSLIEEWGPRRFSLVGQEPRYFKILENFQEMTLARAQFTVFVLTSLSAEMWPEITSAVLLFSAAHNSLPLSQDLQHLMIQRAPLAKRLAPALLVKLLESETDGQVWRQLNRLDSWPLEIALAVSELIHGNDMEMKALAQDLSPARDANILCLDLEGIWGRIRKNPDIPLPDWLRELFSQMALRDGDSETRRLGFELSRGLNLSPTLEVLRQRALTMLQDD